MANESINTKFDLDTKTDRRKIRLGEMECIKTAEDSLQWPVFAICNKFFVSEKAGIFLVAR